MRPSRPDLAMAAVLDGCNTSADVADELGVSLKYASGLLSLLAYEGRIVWRGRYTPRPPGQRGPGSRVYELAS